jgi:hypothetical protein
MAKRVVNINNNEFETYKSPLGTNSRAMFHSFETSEKMNDVVLDVESWLVANNKTWYGSEISSGRRTPTIDFQGSNDAALLNNPNNITAFNYQNLLNNALNGLADIEQNLELGGGMKKKKLIMSSQPIGVFNFPAAAVGLYRKAEYFSPTDNMVIDKTLVQGSIDKGFYYTDKGQKKPLEQRQENTTEMLRVNPTAIPKKTNSGMLYTDPIKYKNVMLKFGTTNRKVYLVKSDVKNIQNKGKEKYVDLYINVMAHGGIQPENVFYSALPSFLAAKILEEAGFKVQIHKMIMIQDYSNNAVCYSTSVKDYGKPIDINKILVQCGDPRTFRWQDFRNWSAFFKAVFDVDLGMGYGRIISTNDQIRVFNDFKAWKRKKIEKGELKEFNKNMRLHLNAGMDATNDNEQTQLRNVENRLKFLLDSVAIEFSGSEQAIKDAIKRDIAKSSKLNIIREFERNLNNPALVPIQPADADLRISDNDFHNILNEHDNQVQKFNQIKPTL